MDGADLRLTANGSGWRNKLNKQIPAFKEYEMLHTSMLNAMSNRRQALKSFFTIGGMAAAATGLSMTACAAPDDQEPEAKPAPKRVPIDFSDPAQNLKAFIKTTGDLDPTVETVGWFGGDVFAVLSPDRPLMKLFGVEGFGVLRVEAQDDGSYRMFNRELAYYKDPKTGEYLDEWQNPLNGETVEVSPIHNMTVNAEIAPIMKMDFDGTVMEVPFSPPWHFFGDKAFSLFEVHTAFPNPMTPEKWPRDSAGPVTRISERFQRLTSLSQLEDPDRTHADYTGVWTRIGPWLPWMLQGQAPGHLLYRTFMNRTGTADKLPGPLVARTEERFPQYFEAPGPETWGGPNDSSFSVYMQEHEPKPAK